MTKIFMTTFQNVKSNLCMKIIWAQLGLFPDKIYNFVFSDKKNKILKSLPTWVFVAPKCWQNFKILQLAWTLTPNKFWTKCLKMPDFCPNSIPILHRNNKKTIFLASFYGWEAVYFLPQSSHKVLVLILSTPKDKRLNQPWICPVVLKAGPLVWESITFTTKPLSYPSDWSHNGSSNLKRR